MKTFTHFLPGITLTGHEFQVPLDHSESNGPHITVFAREIRGLARRGPMPRPVSGTGAPCRTTASCCSTSAAPG